MRKIFLLLFSILLSVSVLLSPAAEESPDAAPEDRPTEPPIGMPNPGPTLTPAPPPVEESPDAAPEDRPTEPPVGMPDPSSAPAPSPTPPSTQPHPPFYGGPELPQFYYLGTNESKTELYLNLCYYDPAVSLTLEYSIGGPEEFKVWDGPITVTTSQSLPAQYIIQNPLREAGDVSFRFVYADGSRSEVFTSFCRPNPELADEADPGGPAPSPTPSGPNGGDFDGSDRSRQPEPPTPAPTPSVSPADSGRAIDLHEIILSLLGRPWPPPLYHTPAPAEAEPAVSSERPADEETSVPVPTPVFSPLPSPGAPAAVPAGTVPPSVPSAAAPIPAVPEPADAGPASSPVRKEPVPSPVPTVKIPPSSTPAAAAEPSSAPRAAAPIHPAVLFCGILVLVLAALYPIWFRKK